MYLEIVLNDQEAKRFWDHVRRGAKRDCWPYDGPQTPAGYGKFFLRGKTLLAHRVASTLTDGPIPNGLLGCHTCDNPPCCNPKHVFRGTHKDNMQDKIRKGRFNAGDRSHSPRGANHWMRKKPERIPRGEALHRSPITMSDVLLIHRLREEGETYDAIASRYGVTKQAIASIIKGRNWRHVDVPAVRGKG